VRRIDSGDVLVPFRVFDEMPKDLPSRLRLRLMGPGRSWLLKLNWVLAMFVIRSALYPSFDDGVPIPLHLMVTD